MIDGRMDGWMLRFGFDFDFGLLLLLF